MGYARIVQYGDITELYEYEKDHVSTARTRYKSELEKKRDRERRKQWVPKSEYSIRRAKTQFFKICSEALYTKGVPMFITLTNHEDDVSVDAGYKHIRQFKDNVKNKMGKAISYIAVPEWQKKGRLHYHLLVWGLCPKEAETERSTRNLQRLYGKGFVDVRMAYDSSPKLASYFAKYFTKAYTERRLSNKKAYTTSRTIDKPRTYGSNAFNAVSDLIIPDATCIIKIDTYNTKYLGRCSLTKYKNNYKNDSK